MNQKTNEFRVLVIDDNPDVIKRLDRLSPKHQVGGNLWDVNVVSIHIELALDKDGAAHISDKSINQILAACSRPFNLVLADYGFASSSQWDDLASGKITPDEFLKKTKTAANVVEEVEMYLTTNRASDISLRNSFSKHLKDFGGKLYLYTYTSSGTKDTFPNVEAREKKTQAAFRKARVIAIDTQRKFFDDYRYEKNYSSPFYAYLVTGLLDTIINRELLEHILIVERARMKFIRHKRSAVAVFIVAALAGGIGSASSWIVEIIIGLFKADKVSAAWTLIALALTVLFAVGISLPFFFERILTNILAKLSSENDE